VNRDFAEMLSALSDAGAEFLVVGAHALAAHGTPRATGDLDIWINPTPANAALVMAALRAFGAPLANLAIEDLTTPGLIFQIGVVPSRVDILTTISGVAFDDAWTRRMVLEIEGVEVPVLGREDFIANKRATGRLKDLADIEGLP